jgi:hypothetical protein
MAFWKKSPAQLQGTTPAAAEPSSSCADTPPEHPSAKPEDAGASLGRAAAEGVAKGVGVGVGKRIWTTIEDCCNRIQDSFGDSD